MEYSLCHGELFALISSLLWDSICVVIFNLWAIYHKNILSNSSFTSVEDCHQGKSRSTGVDPKTLECNIHSSIGLEDSSKTKCTAKDVDPKTLECNIHSSIDLEDSSKTKCTAKDVDPKTLECNIHSSIDLEDSSKTKCTAKGVDPKTLECNIHSSIDLEDSSKTKCTAKDVDPKTLECNIHSSIDLDDSSKTKCRPKGIKSKTLEGNNDSDVKDISKKKCEVERKESNISTDVNIHVSAECRSTFSKKNGKVEKDNSNIVMRCRKTFKRVSTLKLEIDIHNYLIKLRSKSHQEIQIFIRRQILPLEFEVNVHYVSNKPWDRETFNQEDIISNEEDTRTSNQEDTWKITLSQSQAEDVRHVSMMFCESIRKLNRGELFRMMEMIRKCLLVNNKEKMPQIKQSGFIPHQQEMYVENLNGKMNELLTIRMLSRGKLFRMMEMIRKRPLVNSKAKMPQIKQFGFKPHQEIYEHRRFLNGQKNELWKITQTDETCSVDSGYNSSCSVEESASHLPDGGKTKERLMFEACSYCINDAEEAKVLSNAYPLQFQKTALMCAVARKHTACVKAFLNEGADVNQVDHKGRHALITASMTENCTACLYVLITNGAFIDMKDNEGLTALMHAARKGFLQYVVILLDAMTDADGSYPSTWLSMLALIDGTMQDIMNYIPFLGKEHPILNACDKKKKTALIHALEGESFECAQALVKAGADVDKADIGGKTPLTVLLRETLGPTHHSDSVEDRDQLKEVWQERFSTHPLHNNLQAIIILIEAGADVNQPDRLGNTPLIQAVRAQDIQCCQLFLLHGAEVNKQNLEGRTAFMYAARNMNIEIMTNLISFGADINIQDNNQQTALMIIIHTSGGMSGYFYCARKFNNEAVKCLVEHGVNLNARDKHGQTALLTGIKTRQSFECLNLIADKKSIDIPDNDGVTALTHALRLKSKDDVITYASALLKLGADPEIEPQFRSLLHPDCSSQQSGPKLHMDFFLQLQQFEMIQLLVSNGIVHTALESIGVHHIPSPLKTALMKGYIGLAKYFIASCYIMETDMKSLRYLNQCLLTGRSTLKNEGRHLVERAMCQPWPLGKLAFIAVSSALGRGLGREERVRRTGLPVRFQEMLLFRVPASRIPINQWEGIQLCFDRVENERWPMLYYWPLDMDKTKL